jgi:hypothetical protein
MILPRLKSRHSDVTTMGRKELPVIAPLDILANICTTWFNIKILTYLLTELSPSWEAANCAATQVLPSILWNPKVHHRVHKCPPAVPIRSQIDQSTPSHPIPLRSILILSTHLRLGLPSSLLSSGFPTNNILYILITYCSYGFLMFLRIKSDYFSEHY